MILTRALSGFVAAGVVVAGIVLWRVTAATAIPWLRRARWIVALLASYGFIALAHATVGGVPLRDALGGRDGLVAFLPRVLQGAFIGAMIVLPLGWIASLVRVGSSRARGGAIAPAVSQAVALTACIALVFTSLPYAPARTPEQQVAELDRGLHALEAGERVMPRDTWDPDYVVKMMRRDPQRLFEWVRDNTFWIPYHGVLRGPVGVLMDRQGNSLDRAVLLAILLQRARYTVRLAHGALSRDQALELLPRLEAERTVALGAAARRARTVIGATSQQNQDQHFSRIASELQSRVKDQTDRLLKLLSRPNPTKVWKRAFDTAMASVADHWWVQLERGPSWVDLDVVAGTPGWTLARPAETTNLRDLAADLHHTITVRVVAEQWAGGTVSEHNVLEQALRPSDLIGHSVTLQFWPSDWIQSDAPGTRHNRRDALAQESWGAVLAVDDQMVAPGILLANGDDPEVAVKGGATGGLAAAFSNTMGLNQNKADRQLSAVWIEYEIHVPDERPRTIRRMVFDLLGAAGRATARPQLALDDSSRLKRSLALTMKTEILPMACSLSPQFVAALVTRNLVTDRDLIGLTLNGALPAGTGDVRQLLERSAPPISALYGLALARMAANRDEHLFLDRPNILTRHLYAAPAGDTIVLLDSIDIAANEIGVSLSAHDLFAARLAHGVLDTNAESLFHPAHGVSVGDAFAASRSWVAFVSDRDAERVGSLGLIEDVRRRIGSDLAAGYSVVAPERAVALDSGDFTGWWRVDRDTGNAVGVAANGWGGSLPALMLAPIAERTSEESPKVRIARFWKRWILTFGVAFDANYAWCVLPLVQKHGGAYMATPSDSYGIEGTNVKLHHSLGIWEGAVKPIARDAVDECTGDSIIVAGLTASFLPVGVAYKAGRLASGRNPRAPNLPDVEASAGGGTAGRSGGRSTGSAGGGGGGGGGKSSGGASGGGRGGGEPPGGSPHETGSGPGSDSTPGDNSNPGKSNDPCDDGSGVSGTGDTVRDTVSDPNATQYDPDSAPPGDEGPSPQISVAEATANEVAAKAAWKDAFNEVETATQKFVRYRQDSVPDWNEQTWQQLLDDANHADTIANYKWDELEAAERALRQAKSRARGAAGHGGLSCGGGGSAKPEAITSLDPALYQAPQSGNTLQGIGPAPEGDVAGQSSAASPSGQSQQSWDGKPMNPYFPSFIPTPTDTSSSDLDKAQNTPGDNGDPAVKDALQKLWDAMTGSAGKK
jgi:hypothetical protein